MKLKHWTVIFILLTQGIHAQNMWLWNQRTHPELKWQTLETEHFNIHFHQGIESIARKGALIAEQVYQPILDQLQIEDFGKTDIVFSAEDEIMNGFAMPSNQIFIWVSQNDVAGGFGGSEKWLKIVIAHEFQHVVQFQAHRTWVGILGAVSIPSWWTEGMAEYMTEIWRVGRSDSRMKIHTYRNTMDKLNPHDDGYAKVLYLSWKYGDSTLVNISKHRLYLKEKSQKYPYWYDFKKAFSSATGQSLKDFNEEWRRVMNTYYYGYKSQKETIEEVGDPLLLKGFSKVLMAVLSGDSTMIAVVGRKDDNMLDYSLYSMTTDTTHQIQELHHGRFSSAPAWSPDSRHLIVAEYHRGSHGSLLNDLRLINVKSKKARWLTRDLRALHPLFSLDGKGVYFVAHPGETTQIYYQDLSTEKQVVISRFEGDVQIQSLDLSPDGQQLAFMIQAENGDVNIAVMNRDGQQFQKVTDDPEEDLFPVWTADGKSIVFTSYRNSTPNLYRVNMDNLNVVQMTDVAEGVYSQQRLPGTDRIIATSLGDVDTVRIRTVESGRVAPELTLNIREPFKGWRTKAPDIPLPKINYRIKPKVIRVHPYRALKSVRPLLRMIWPDVEGLFGMAVYNDALGKHLLQGSGVINWSGELAGGYFNYTNLQYWPVINIYGMRNFSFSLRRTWKKTRFEVLNGAGIMLSLPLNSGNSLSSNQQISINLRLVTRTVMNLDADNAWEADLAFPQSNESNLSLNWRWLSRRPEADRLSLPTNGRGLLAHVEKTFPQKWGDGDYQKVWFEGFINIKIPKTPFVVYNRSKWEAHSGTILAQDSIGFMTTSPLYFSSGTLMNMAQIGIMDFPESYNLRGQIENYPASELFYNVSELRIPLFKSFPAQILGVSLSGITGALFYDWGYLPETRSTLSTMGAEVKFNLTIGELALLTLSTGLGGDSHYWDRIVNESDNQDSQSDPYFRLALVNPF